MELFDVVIFDTATRKALAMPVKNCAKTGRYPVDRAVENVRLRLPPEQSVQLMRAGAVSLGEVLP